MLGFSKRTVALPFAILGAVASVGLGSSAAHAATGIVSGTGTLTASMSFLGQLAQAGVVMVPQGQASLTANGAAHTVTTVYNATGGDATLTVFAGSVLYSGNVLFFDVKTGKSVTLGSLQYDMTNNQFDGATATSGAVALFDPAGTMQGTITGAAQSFSASGLVVDTDGAAFLNTALGTTVFTAGQQVGSFSTTYTR
jgi:hypothetical protein